MKKLVNEAYANSLAKVKDLKQIISGQTIGKIGFRQDATRQSEESSQDEKEIKLRLRLTNACCQQKILWNWGLKLKQSSAVYIQALVSADVILPGSSS